MTRRPGRPTKAVKVGQVKICLTPLQRDALRILGGSKWVQEQIERNMPIEALAGTNVNQSNLGATNQAVNLP